MLARKEQKRSMEVLACAIRNTAPPLLTKTWLRLGRSVLATRRLIRRYNELAWPYCFTKTPIPIVTFSRTTWACMFSGSASGANVGPLKGFRWMTSLVRVGPGVFPPKEVAFVIAAACSWPADHDLPLSHFSLRELAKYVAKDVSMSLSSVWRCLHAHALYPWRKRSWISPRDPHFLERATPVLDLYQGFWQGEPLGEGDFVISADEKPNIQALRGTQASKSVIPGHPAHMESDYIRCGTLAYLAALDIQSGRVLGRIDERTGIRPFMRLVDKVMTQKPFSKARRVFWIVDNGASHHPKTFPERLKARYPNAIAVHLPIHASWLNQIEIFFSILQRKLLKRGRFEGLFGLGDAILQYQSRYNRTAKPFKWNFTASDLKERLATCY